MNRSPRDGGTVWNTGRYWCRRPGSREAGWFKKGQDARRRQGRPRSARDRVPRSTKASLLQVLGEIEEHHADDIESGLLAGIRAKPPVSFPYIQIALAYRFGGKPVHRVQVVDPLPIEIHIYNDPDKDDGE